MMEFMNAVFVKHEFFPQGALMLVMNGEMCFLYQTPESKYLHLWFSYEPFTNVLRMRSFLNECVKGKHTDKGFSHTGTMQEIIDDFINH